MNRCFIFDSFNKKCLHSPIHTSFILDMIGTILLLRITRQWFNRISEAKDYFLRTFYKEAPIPRALKLGSPDSALSFENNSETFKFLDREMDLYLRSGASLIFRCDLFSD